LAICNLEDKKLFHEIEIDWHSISDYECTMIHNNINQYRELIIN